ncbi:hypothetical protein [Nocardia sp. NPDC051832]|uniref:hypothetical protein n=1 Tax=Nocardia sp. NPDC051832 TaxID=3155673 RepID=UPI00342C6360
MGSEMRGFWQGGAKSFAMEGLGALVALPIASYFWFADGREVSARSVLTLLGLYFAGVMLAAFLFLLAQFSTAAVLGPRMVQKAPNILTGAVAVQVQPTQRWAFLATIAAGPLTNVVSIPVLAALPLAPGLGAVLAAGALHGAITDLVPAFDRRTGSMNAGARLFIPVIRRAHTFDLAGFVADPDFRDRADRIDEFLRWYRLGIPRFTTSRHVLAQMLRQNGRFDDLLALHADDPPAQSAGARTEFIVEMSVLTWPDVPADAVDRAAVRLRRYLAEHPRDEFFQSTLALARVRQGHGAEAEALCRTVLARDLVPAYRAAVLATRAMACHLLGDDGRPYLREARQLSLDNDKLWTASLLDEATAWLPDLDAVEDPVGDTDSGSRRSLLDRVSDLTGWPWLPGQSRRGPSGAES